MLRVACRLPRISSACAWKVSPAGVSRVGYDERSTRSMPAQASSAWMRRENAGCVTCRSCAEREKLRVSARLTKSSSHLVSTAYQRSTFSAPADHPRCRLAFRQRRRELIGRPCFSRRALATVLAAGATSRHSARRAPAARRACRARRCGPGPSRGSGARRPPSTAGAR